MATLFKATLAGVNYFEAPYLILNLTSKDPCKRTQPVVGKELPTLLYVTCCAVRLHTLAHVVGSCCTKFETAVKRKATCKRTQQL